MAAIMYPAYGMDSYTDMPKVQSAVMQWIESQDADTHAANADANADTANAGTTGPATLSVYLHLDSEDSIGSLPDFIVPESSSYNIVVAFLTADQIMQASAFDIVTQITIPDRAVPTKHGSSEGVSFMGADRMHNWGLGGGGGITGDGIKVAVIDVDFFPNNTQIASNVVHAELIDSSNDCDNDISCGEDISHGTATAEVVVDMAPDVSLYLYAIGHSLDFNEAISDAMSRGVDIIQVSLGFPGAGPPSGKEFRNGESIVAKKVNEAEAAGVTVVISAGNDGDEYILTKYTPSRTPIPPTLNPNYQSLMEFQPSAFGIQKACLPVSYYGDAWLVLVWDDHWSGATHDYDLYLYDRQMRTIIDYSKTDQSGLFHTPVESILMESDDTSRLSGCLVVASWSTSEDHQLRIYADAMHADKTRSGSIDTPADATGAIAVGAVDVHDNRITDYSSAGPTDDGRPKPEICGATNVLNHQYTRGYHGTSASAPHVSGLVALLMEADPSLQGTGKDKILDILNQHARSHSSYSRANLCGPGVASLVTYQPPPPAPSNFNASPGDMEVILSWDKPPNSRELGITGYIIQYREKGQTWQTHNIDAALSQYTVTGLTNGISYEFMLSAKNNQYTGKPAPAEATPVGPPTAPTNLKAIPGNASVTLNWDAPATGGGAQITGYEIQYRADTDHDTANTIRVDADITTHTVTGLTNGVSYEFTVSAINSAGTGTATAPVHAIPENRVRIGVLVSTTGGLATLGNDINQTVQYAVEEFNQYLTSQGKDWSLEISTFNDGADPHLALEGIRALDASGIKAVLGPLTSHALSEIADHVNNNDMVVVSYGSTAPTLANPGDRIFRTVADSSMLADAFVAQMQHDNIAYILPVFRDDEWGSSFNHTLVTSLPDGITPLAGIRYDIAGNTADHHDIIADAMAKRIHPDTSAAVILLGFDEVAGITNAASKHPQLLAAKWYANDIIPADLADTTKSQKFLNDVTYTIGTQALPDNSITAAIDAHLPGAGLYSYAAYDAVFILGKAIDKVGDATDAAALARSIPEIARMHQAALGNTTLNAAGDLAHANYNLDTFIGTEFVTTAHYPSDDSGLQVITYTGKQGTPYGLISSVVGDWDGDGDHDIGSVGIAHDGRQAFTLENVLDDNMTSTAFAGTLGATSGYLPGTLRPLVGDWDGDGDDDIGAVGLSAHTSNLHFTLHANATNHDAVFVGDLDGAAAGSFLPDSLMHIVGDWDGDGADDIGFVGASADGTYAYNAYRIQTGSDATLYASSVLSDSYTGYLAGTVEPIIGDWDGDGDDDLGLTGIIPSGLRQFVLYANDRLVFDKFTGDYNFYIPGSFTYLIGDWDGDGDDDFGTVGLDRGRQFFTLTTDLEKFEVFFISAVGESRFYLPGKLVTLVGDWDGDGDDDIGAAGIDFQGRQHFLLSPYNIGTGFNIQYIGILGNAVDYLVPRSATYDITITSSMPGQPLTPPLLATHDADISMFREGHKATPQLRGLAENGAVSPFLHMLATSPDVASAVAATSPIHAFSDSQTVQISTDGNHPYISFASMLICTNDGFAGLDTTLLTGTSTHYPRIYDAGTEMNTEDYADLPPPCQDLTVTTSDKTGTDISNPAIAESSTIMRHGGIAGTTDLAPGIVGNGWAELPIQVTIKRAY